MKSPGPWTLAELIAALASELETTESPRDERVNPSPNVRTLRYYAMLGLLGPPLGHRGRQALYGPDHLQRLVAIKRLQAQGLSLAQVQVALAERPRSRPTSPRFWTKGPSRAGDAKESAPLMAASNAPLRSQSLTALELAPGVTVMVATPLVPLTPGDARTLRQAARPLLAWLSAHTHTAQTSP